VSPRLPQVSGDDLVGMLRGLGYEVLRQRGSHVRLRKLTPSGEHNISVPMHKVIAKGTLNDIISKVSIWNGISREDLLNKL
jgi:predicted RNA binding protein YcfA (HicA-like mRNA interferase family)